MGRDGTAEGAEALVSSSSLLSLTFLLFFGRTFFVIWTCCTA